MTGKKLGVIILNWNGEELMKQFLPTAVRYTIERPRGDEVDLIVADNGSTDNSVEWIKTHYPKVKVMELGKNYGFAEGYNIAIARGDYPYTVLLNSDVEVKEGWWEPLLDFMEIHPEAGAVQPKIKSWHKKEYFEYAGAAGGYLDYLGYPYCRGRVQDEVEKDEGQYDGEAADVCWASGAALMVRRDVYLKLGGLDPLFFAHMEEIDLCCRMLAAGYRVYALTNSEVYHVGGASLPQGNPRKTYLNFRNNLLLLYKNLPGKVKSRKLILRRLADTAAVLMFLAKGDIANSKAVVKAHRDFRKMKKEYKNLPEVADDYRFPGSERKILLEHYIKRPFERYILGKGQQKAKKKG